MNSWDTGMAKMFQDRNNIVPLGAMIGVILKPLPDIKIKLLQADWELEKDKIFLSHALTNRLKIECTIKEFESQGNTSKDNELANNTLSTLNTAGGGKTPLISHNGTLQSMSSERISNSKENKKKGKFILQTIFNLEPGMHVLVIPNQTEDQFFVVDVFTPAEEVDLSWEYYQK